MKSFRKPAGKVQYPFRRQPGRFGRTENRVHNLPGKLLDFHHKQRQLSPDRVHQAVHQSQWQIPGQGGDPSQEWPARDSHLPGPFLGAFAHT
jgi:hypothetical protein